MQINSKNAREMNVTVISAFKYVTLHLEVTILGAEMDIGGQHHLNVGFLLRQGSHGGWCLLAVAVAVSLSLSHVKKLLGFCFKTWVFYFVN